MDKCILCKNEIFPEENCFGTGPFGDRICLFCWGDLTENQIAEYIKEKGFVPNTRSFITEEWKEYCGRFGLRP